MVHLAVRHMVAVFNTVVIDVAEVDRLVTRVVEQGAVLESCARDWLLIGVVYVTQLFLTPVLSPVRYIHTCYISHLS